MQRRKEAVIIGRDKDRKKGFDIISHELSHHFTRNIGGKYLPIWFNEGMAEYFGHCEVGKKGVKHTLTAYERGRVRTMYMLEDIDLRWFVNSNRAQFMERQQTDERYAYILSHALASFWVDEVPRPIFTAFISTLKEANNPSTSSERIDRIYPGGFMQFEQDFAAFCK